MNHIVGKKLDIRTITDEKGKLLNQLMERKY